MSSGADEGRSEKDHDEEPRSFIFGGQGVQAGRDNTQINYIYSRRTPPGGMSLPPLSRVSGPVDSPYRGLGSFVEEDAPFFFGREEATSRLLTRMSELADSPGLLVVSGPSGAGKSSLLRAGVLPRLRGEGLKSSPDAASWPHLFFTPGRAPLDELAVQTARLPGTQDAGAIRQQLREHPPTFALTARLAALEPSPSTSETPRPTVPGSGEAAARRIILIVDQFEQVFTQCEDEAERRAFIDALHAAAHGPGDTPGALVVLGVRADFEARCVAYAELEEPVQNRYLVTPMTDRQLRLAITGPAGKTGARVDDGLTETLLSEVRARQPEGTGAGVLPLLSHALDQAWRSRAGQDLTLSDYERTGGIEEAVAASAERAYSRLDSGAKAAARQVFIRLVATGPDGTDTADRATRAELVGSADGGAEEVNQVLETFTAERLLTLTADSVEISHEALLTSWPLLRDTWLAETHSDRLARTRLRNTASEWERRSRDPSYLYRGTLLQNATDASKRTDAHTGRSQPLSRSERDFLQASNQSSRRSAQRRRSAVTFLAVVALMASGLAIWANQQRVAVSQQRDQAIANQLAAQTEQLSSTNPSLAAQFLNAAHSMDRRDQELGERLVSTENQPLGATQPGVSATVALSRDGRTLAAVNDHGIALWNFAGAGSRYPIGQRIGTIPAKHGSQGISSIAFSPDGRTLVAGDENGDVTLWNVADPAHPRQLGGPLHDGTGIYAVAFSPNGRTIAASGGPVMIWNITNPAHPLLLSKLGSSQSDGYELAFSPDGRTLATCDLDRSSIVLWNITNPAHPAESSTFSTPSSAGTIAFSPENHVLAEGISNEIVLWNVTDPRHPVQLGAPFSNGTGALDDNGNNVNSLEFSPDGHILAAADTSSTRQVVLWNITALAHPERFAAPLDNGDGSGVDSVVFSPDGRSLVAGSDGDGVTRWGLPSAVLARNFQEPAVSAMAVTSGSRGAVLATGNAQGLITLWNVTDPAQPAQLGEPFASGEIHGVNSLAFSPDGRTLAAGTASANAVALWNVANPVHPRPLGTPLGTGQASGADSVAFSPSGTVLAVGDGENNSNSDHIALWNVTNLAHPAQLSTPTDNGTGGLGVNSVVFSPNGHIMAGGGVGGEVTLWNTADPAHPKQIGPLATRQLDLDDRASVAFSPQGTALAVSYERSTIGASQVALWNISRPARPRQLSSPPVTGNGSGALGAFAMGGHLAASSTSGTVALWNVNSGQPEQFGTPLATNDSVTAIVSSPDGSTIAAEEADGTVQVWNDSVKYAANRICRLTSGAQAPPQWHQYVPEASYGSPCEGDG